MSKADVLRMLLDLLGRCDSFYDLYRCVEKELERAVLTDQQE